ncbi:MAG: DUF4350 domain-containing protein [Ferruginibacter sp.]
MNKGLSYILFFCITLLAGGCKVKRPMPDMVETYLSTDTRPFGGNVAFRILQNSYKDNYIQKTKLPFEDASTSTPDTASVYFCLANNFYTKSEDADAILDYVYKGNTFFLSAANIDSVLLEKIYCKVKDDDEVFFPPFFKATSVRLIEEADTSKSLYSYFYLPFTSHFSEVNEIYSRIIGYNSREEANCIVFFWGKGKMFLHTAPRSFSNYFLLKNDNHLYMEKLCQLMNESPEHVYWNDYYSQQSNPGAQDGSSLRQILKFPQLSAAFWIALLLLFLFIVFEIKRRQRIIKQIAPNVNSSVAFTETIARLYLQQNDNKNIADKMITYFNEYIRSNYYLHSNMGSDDFIKTLSRKSGVSLEKTTSLYHAINHANQHDNLDDYQLLSLNEQIQQFYKKRK